MAHEVKIHQAQTRILRELLFHPSANYAKLQKPTGLGSDHFNFHIKRLVELDYVEKDPKGFYKLTIKGKEYANRLDTDEHTIERQPKVAVLLGVINDLDDKKQYLFQQRTKNPYFGYWGFITGKIRWGETVIQAAERELLEESNLTADKIEVVGIYHEQVFLDGQTEFQEDKLFFLVRCTKVKGKLIEKFEGGNNHWFTKNQTRNLNPVYASFNVELDNIINAKPINLIEKTQFVDKKDF